MSKKLALGIAFTLLHDVIYDKVSEAYDRFVDENSIPQKSESNSRVVAQIADEQTELGYQDIMQQKDLSEEDINDQVRDYVTETYDDDFLIVKLTEKVDYAALREDRIADLLLNLMNREPYNVVPREYWKNQARRVPDIKELSDYRKTDGLEPFVEKYAPEWEEIANENKDEAQ